MNIPKDLYKSLTEIYEIDKIVEVKRPPTARVALKTNDEGTQEAEKIPSRRFRVIAARDLYDPDPPRYVAFVEELIRLKTDGPEVQVWKDVTYLALGASAQSGTACINLALGYLNSQRL